MIRRDISSYLVFCLATLAVAGLVTACSSTPKPKIPEGGVTPITPKKGVYLRSGFDADPSDYIGRFIEDDIKAADIDETDGVETKCSQHIEYTEVRAGGTYDEEYKASRSASASIGVSPVPQAAGASGGASAGTEDGAVVRVKYTLTKKMRGTKTPEYYDCCRSTVNGCSGRFLAEFWAGTGEIYQYVGSKQQFEANANVPATAKADVDFKNGVAWKRAMTFDDLYFAFTTADAEIDESDCGWVDKVPQSDDGQYFVGVSVPAATESKARSLAMRDARKQVVQYLGEFIRSATATKSNTMEGYLEDEEILQTMAEGVARRVKDDRYCPAETRKSPEGVLYISRVLAFFPEEDKAEAAREAVENLEKKLEERGELTDEERKELETIKVDLAGEGVEAGGE